jgi:hypothetical protein
MRVIFVGYPYFGWVYSCVYLPESVYDVVYNPAVAARQPQVPVVPEQRESLMAHSVALLKRRLMRRVEERA